MWKRQLYADYGVAEYWVVDAWRRTVEIYRLQEDTLILVATLRHGEAVTSPLLPDFALPVADVFRF